MVKLEREGEQGKERGAERGWQTHPGGAGSRCWRTKDASFFPRNFNSWNQTSPILSSQGSRDPTEERASA